MQQGIIAEGLDRIAASHPAIAEALQRFGYPDERIQPRGHATLLRIILGQQVSVASAEAVWRRLTAMLGDEIAPAALLAASHEDLRACGLSRQKEAYARSLCELVAGGALDLHALPDDDQQAIAQLMEVKGIGRWSAEIYLLFAEGRQDIWPAGDLAIRVGIGRILGLDRRPNETETRLLAEPWRPWRGAVAVFIWHVYQSAAV
ncbi:DNA-3-methyladenine glycosylase 2 family protein [Croceicoccus sp. F390]|uniref:DNA-3-methyladenine glycosylase II n=1 Tax=Croceicoccus esteveae TaxID=3075597 RepID=A0ABU2ZGF3_9SPHN|nr:DNA-3-methyladenine glycosylase 2 family protein [Croceicoccus sp. F390]MDT0575667.1 DNA-3-methyladenine glycosylase 2 family protein [Croceicoccus sp. F390]